MDGLRDEREERRKEGERDSDELQFRPVFRCYACMPAGFREMNCRNSSGTKVKYVSFNQDNSACIVVNEDGYKIVSLLPTAAPVDPDEDFNQESMRQNMEQEG